MLTILMKQAGMRGATQTLTVWAGLCLIALFALLRLELAVAQTEIYRCKQADGTTAFQEQPCPAEAEKTEAVEEASDNVEQSANGFFDFENPFDAPLSDAQEPQTENRPDSRERSLCEEQARDAIDAIEQEMLQQYSSEQRDDYLTRLRTHTAELRACKQL